MLALSWLLPAAQFSFGLNLPPFHIAVLVRLGVFFSATTNLCFALYILNYITCVCFS